MLFEDLKTNPEIPCPLQNKKKSWIPFLFPYKFINFWLCFLWFRSRVSSQSFYNLFQQRKAIIMLSENNGFHKMVIIDHPELEILYVVSVKASKWSVVE